MKNIKTSDLKRQNCEPLMRSQLPDHIYHLLVSIGRFGDRIGLKTFVVGGFVRDLLIGRPNLDVDIVVEGDGIDFARKLAEEQEGKTKCHQRFGTAVVTLSDGFKIDIATARTESYSRPGALPSVQFGSIKDDLKRRDFTINAMAIELSENQFGRLVDFFDGILDLREGLIRVMHDLSFVDDPTRIFRCIRFEQRYEFSLEPHTEDLLKEAVSKSALNTISMQRLRNEILLILKEDHLYRVLKRMAHFSLIKYVHPRIFVSDDLAELFNRTKEIIDWWSIWGGEPADPILLNLITLLDQLSLEEVEEVSDRLVLRGRYASALRASKVCIIDVLPKLSKEIPPSRIYGLLKGFSLEVLLFAMAKADEKAKKDAIKSYLIQLRRIKPLISGSDLRKLGYPEGPLYNQILSEVFSRQLDGLITDKQSAVQFVKQLFCGVLQSLDSRYDKGRDSRSA